MLRPLAPPQSEVHKVKPLHVVTLEEQRIAADLAYNRMKNSGELRQREIDRAHWAEIQAGEHL